MTEFDPLNTEINSEVGVCLYCKQEYPWPTLDRHEKECRGLMPDYDSTPLNEPWPPPARFFDRIPDPETTYWVIHPALLTILLISAFFFGTWLGVCIGVVIAS